MATGAARLGGRQCSAPGSVEKRWGEPLRGTARRVLTRLRAHAGYGPATPFRGLCEVRAPPRARDDGASRSTWRPGAGGHGTPSRRASANPGCRRKGSSEPAEPAETLGLVKINFENYGEMQTCSDQQKHFLTGGPAF